MMLRKQREKKKRDDDEEEEVWKKEVERELTQCLEMEKEEGLSIIMEKFYRNDHEKHKQNEIQRLEELKLLTTISKTRRKTRALGMTASTPGVSGLERLRELEMRILEKEEAIEKSHEAKARLDALPAKRSELKKLMYSFVSHCMKKKLEHVIYHQYCDRLLAFFDPVASAFDNKSFDLLNHESSNGFTPVLVAIFRGKPRILRRLLELGASPNTETQMGITPLLAAVMTGDLIAFHLLVEFKVDLNHVTKNHVNAMLLAVDKGREDILKALLECRAHVDSVNGAGRSTLIQAAISGNVNLCRILLANNADKELRDSEGKTALEWAIVLRDVAMVSTLTSSLTASDRLTQLKAEMEDEDGEAPSLLSGNQVVRQNCMAQMNKAMREADLMLIRELLLRKELELGPNYEDAMGNTPLLVVCKSGTYADIVFCLKNNCIPTHQNREGINALMVVCKRGDTAMIQLLMQCGGNLWTRDFAGHDAVFYLNTYDHPDLATDFTNQYYKQSKERNPALVLGSIVASSILVAEEDSASIHGHHEGDAGEKVVNDCRVPKWRDEQQAFEQDWSRQQRSNSQGERILNARTRGRRNGLIAPLPSVPSSRPKFPICEHCHQLRAHKRCRSCDQVLCDKCHARLHAVASRRHHLYEMLELEEYVKHERKEEFDTNQGNAFKSILLNSTKCVAAMRRLLLDDEDLSKDALRPHFIDFEVENYQRTKRYTKEKVISQMQINVPMCAAKHAAKAGEETIFALPAELDLAALYTTQKKYQQSQQVLQKVEQLVTDSLGILHPALLKVAIGKARIMQETGQFEQCVATMQNALSRFENIVPLDNGDVVIGTSMLLESLNTLGHYSEAIATCRHVQSIRARALPCSHEALQEIQEQLDKFRSKRENEEMSHEDLIALERAEQERKHMMQLATEREEHWTKLKHLMMEDLEGLATFKAFARQEFTDDLVTFWISVEKFKQDKVDTLTLQARAVAIYRTYIKSRRLGILTVAQRKHLKKRLTTPNKVVLQTLYDDIQSQVFAFICHGVYARYLVHETREKAAG